MVLPSKIISTVTEQGLRHSNLPIVRVLVLLLSIFVIAEEGVGTHVDWVVIIVAMGLGENILGCGMRCIRLLMLIFRHGHGRGLVLVMLLGMGV